MPVVIGGITVFCFAASYVVALALEILHLLRPGRIQRVLGLVFGGAGLLAHTIYVTVQPLDLASPFGSLLFLAWILAVFYLYGSIHHKRLAWGLFVLPMVLGLIALAKVFPHPPGPEEGDNFLRALLSPRGQQFWGTVHGILVLLAAVGVCVGFLASVMYLVQVRRLKAKMPPGQGVRLLSLERIEDMNRRGILWAFPLLTAGLLVGVALQLHGGLLLDGWDSPKIVSSVLLWLVFAILLYMRYGVHVRGRQLALLTIMAFALLLFALVSPVHTFGAGGGP